MKRNTLVTGFLKLVWLSVVLQFGFSGSALSNNETLAYIEVMASMKEVQVDEQIQLLRKYLQEYPNSPYREEIEKNILNMRELLNEIDPKRKKQKTDTDLYYRASAMAKNLSLSDQLALWEQFKKENPESMYKSDVDEKIRSLRIRLKRTSRASPNDSDRPSVSDYEPVVKRLPYKDPQKGLWIATLGGIIVPGMGHWYAKDYVLAGILSAVRISGIAIGVSAYQNSDQSIFNLAILLTAFSYIADVADTPFAVQRYNARLEELDSRAQNLDWYERGPASPNVEISLIAGRF